MRYNLQTNKIGICEWVLPLQGPYALKLASELGYDGIQLADLGGSGKGFPLNNRRIQQGYLDFSKEYGVVLHSLHLHTLVREGTMIFPFTTPQGEAAIKSIKAGITACVAMGIPVLMLSSFFASQILNEYDFINFAEMLKIACDIGADNGIQVVFESILHIERILKMLDMVGDKLKICYDTLNPLRFGSGDPQVEIIKLGRAVIDHIHFKDAPEDFNGCCLLGSGRGKFFDSVNTIKEIGFSSWFITENYYCLPPMGGDNDPLELAKKDHNMIRKLFPITQI